MKPSLHLIILGWFVLLGPYPSAAYKTTVVVQNIQSSVASLIRNATFLEKTPEFTDLYIIQTSDKGRQIVIYCNSAYCYKRNGHMMMV